jgi:pyruvate/2-oxoglutarate dehydrogenase complex dihydrolipoamide dehydrogenase (E3) component
LEQAGRLLPLRAAALGAQGVEIIAMLQIAMMGSLPHEKLLYGMFAHPTYAESLNSLFMAIGQEVF